MRYKYETPTTNARWEKLCCSGQSWYQIAEEMKLDCRQLERELTAAREEITILKSKYADHHAEAERLTSEIRSVTEQRDELLRYNEAFRKETLICADCDSISKEEYDRAIERVDGLRSCIDYASDQLHKVTEQRDRLAEALTKIARGEPNWADCVVLAREAIQSLNQPTEL